MTLDRAFAELALQHGYHIVAIEVDDSDFPSVRWSVILDKLEETP